MHPPGGPADEAAGALSKTGDVSSYSTATDGRGDVGIIDTKSLLQFSRAQPLYGISLAIDANRRQPKLLKSKNLRPNGPGRCWPGPRRGSVTTIPKRDPGPGRAGLVPSAIMMAYGTMTASG